MSSVTRVRASDVPAPVTRLCRELQAAGHEALVVGGAVRDVLLGRLAGDFDVATSATPDQVTALFRRVIPTGVQHGTVTVRQGGHSIEVTSFRGEGAYSDARRPDAVRFGVPLTEDLARRDFTVNALAFDPCAEELVDPFGGQDDLAAGILRAVGDPAERFAEDGLRVMRAVRFVAALELSLEPATEAAIPGALGSLSRVAAERIAVELYKLLSAREPTRGLAAARRTGVLATILPELAEDASFAAVDATEGDAPRRLAALLYGSVDARTAEAIARRLKLSNHDRERIVAVIARGTFDASAPRDDAELRRLLRTVGVTSWADVIAVRLARARTSLEPLPPVETLRDRTEEILARGDPLDLKALAITGKDVMQTLDTKGPVIGRVLELALDRVLADPTLNTRDALLPMLPELAATLHPR